jgi:hypothetical protein
MAVKNGTCVEDVRTLWAAATRLEQRALALRAFMQATWLGRDALRAADERAGRH